MHRRTIEVDHASDLPAALAVLHRETAVGAQVLLTLAASGSELTGEPEHLTDVVVGAGFEVASVEGEIGERTFRLRARRARSLPDHVGPGMRLLLCGLNPSLFAADAGVGFARPGNRFWPAMVAAGLATVPRDPRHLLRHHRIGMTDLVKRATVAAAEVTPEEFATGVARVERLCAWLRPGALYLVGLQGWRSAVDRRAQAGWQADTFGGVPVYLAPSTSGLNASTQLDGHVAHLRAALTHPSAEPATDPHQKW